MLTNLLASVVITLVTNTVETPSDFERYEPTSCPEGRIGCAVYHSRGVNPQGKVVTTTVLERTALQFDWAGQKREVVQEKELSRKEEHWLKGWYLSPTNETFELTPFIATNFYSLTNLWK